MGAGRVTARKTRSGAGDEPAPSPRPEEEAPTGTTASKATRGLPPDLEQRLRQAADRARTATLERNELIVEASQAGGSLREIGQAVEMHYTSVRKILRG